MTVKNITPEVVALTDTLEAREWRVVALGSEGYQIRSDIKGGDPRDHLPPIGIIYDETVAREIVRAHNQLLKSIQLCESPASSVAPWLRVKGLWREG